MEQWRGVLGEEAVQSQLRSSHRNYDTFGHIQRDMMERGHYKDALQCRIKVKELRNAYRKAREANRCSGAAPATCHFYKELDAILWGDPTSTPSTNMNTSQPSSTRREEEEEQQSRSKGAEVEEDTPESLDACSQELFSSQEEGSQSWRLVLGEGQIPEEVPAATLRSQPSVLSPAERLQRIRKRPRRSKEDMLHEVMQHSSNENRKVQEWQDSERRICQQNEDRRHKSVVLRQQSTDRLISKMECQADSIQALVAMQAEHYRARAPLQPLSQNSFPCAPMSPPTHFSQHPGSYRHQLPPTPVASPPSPEDYDSYPLHSTPITMQYSHPEVQHSLHSTPDRKAEYDNRTYANL
ncbi:uncharacterized protein LOC141991511 [Natator depressus]|uniref:uncharacterized protein LOC141991511 n=1 Tax=Natator depressus TaxID=27790 RepID=UPI003EB75497